MPVFGLAVKVFLALQLIPLTVESHIPESGVIFSDGVENDFLAFNAETSATIGLAPVKTMLMKNTAGR